MTTDDGDRAVWCGQCVDEGVEEPHRLGTVRRTPEGVRFWDVEDRRLARKHKLGNKSVAYQVLIHPVRSSVPVPDELPAACKVHGLGVVSSADVINGSVVLTLKATV
jgi:hypothetical protein